MCVCVSKHVCLIKYTYLIGDVGNDMYLREAHRQVSSVCVGGIRVFMYGYLGIFARPKGWGCVCPCMYV